MLGLYLIMEKLVRTILLSSLLSVSCIGKTNGQDSTLSRKSMLLDSAKKKGVYISFTEFQQNNPSREDKFYYKVVKRDVGGPSEYWNTYLMTHNKKGKERKIRGAWGFCDGTNTYVKSSSFAKSSSFNRILHYGFYCVYKDSGISQGVSAIEGTTALPMWFSYTWLIDYRTGYEMKLTKSNLLFILRDDPELLEEFKNEKKPKKVLLTYMIKYNERNTSKLL